MGYFSNGSEHGFYTAKLCDRCVHGTDQGKGCPVMNLHWMWNYDQCGDSEDAKTKEFGLSMFIPRSENGDNEECRMFVELKDNK